MSSKRPGMGATRTRTGCWTCRGRSVKCDEHRPACLKCQKAGLSCSFGVRLTWIEDSIARGMCHGREGVINKTRKRARSSTQTTQATSRAASSVPSTASCNTLQNTISPLDQRLSPLHFINTSYQDVVFYLQADDDDAHDSTIPATRRNHVRVDNGNADMLSCEDITKAPSPAHQEQAGSITRVLGGKWAPLFGNISRAESHLLDFYTVIVCSKATILDEREHNPFRFILLPMAMSSTRIYHGLLAVAAGKMAATGKDCHTLALKYRQYALGGLRQLLSTLSTEPQDLVEALASAIALCWFEIADHCQPTWTDHLAAISVLLDVCTNHPSIPAYAHDIIRFGWQYFAYHLVMAKTTFPVHKFIPTSSSPSSSTSMHGSLGSSSHNTSPESRIPVPPLMPSTSSNTSVYSRHRRYKFDASKNAYVDAYQGFSNTLLFLIDEVCELRTAAQTEAAATLSINDVAVIIYRIEQELISLRQLPPKPYWFEGSDTLFHDLFSEDSPPVYSPSAKHAHQDTSRTRILESTAEAHRVGALLFLDETCALYWPDIVPQSRAIRSQLVDQVIDLSLSIESDNITAAFPVWAVFMAGCMACGDTQRRRILNIFSLLEKTMFRSIPPARKVVEMVWRQQDLTVDENPRVAASWEGPFRTWKRAAGHISHDECGGGSINDHELPDMRPRRQKNGGKMPKQPCGSSAAQFPWERAMSILGECKLSLT
ncbi:hypothetical protein F503_03308 [Ophiostoma piceae UAMH 11346]|uniref:Zn(2)-C6 fungal-type domain-containing protein n=1 Tax=Ophiostoma piceae (strain UAMH 11346) TaxID=1262450 RepID=S3C4V7_OPHP1|nr:hypothetical protein F503_03308 [Ophiostoma piceae UAMH 11346]